MVGIAGMRTVGLEIGLQVNAVINLQKSNRFELFILFLLLTSLVIADKRIGIMPIKY